MKLKEDIIKWKEEVRQMKEQTQIASNSAVQLNKDFETLKNQVSKLLEITEQMANTMIDLIRQQMGD